METSIKAGDLVPAKYNPRKITPDQHAILKKTMLEYGDLSGIVVNINTGNIVGGHQRVKVFDPSWPIIKNPVSDQTGTVAEGYIKTPYGRWSYREVSWDEKKEMAANLAANKAGGDFDYQLLPEILIDLNDTGIDTDLTGFARVEIESLVGGDPIEPESEPEDNYAEQHGVIVICESESHQEEVYNMLNEQGYNCKVVNT